LSLNKFKLTNMFSYPLLCSIFFKMQNMTNPSLPPISKQVSS
jgi:hypothetical protein